MQEKLQTHKNPSRKQQSSQPKPPGPELNKAVAERVMGIENVQIAECGAWGEKAAHYYKGTFLDPLIVPRYSTDITAAMQITERLIADEFLFQLINLSDDFGWSCSFYKKHYATCHEWFTADTAPHAICLAALEAK